jgi:NAD(P)-dependent dehydrogenase (short-subunit alcohol dehydrogenase family)
MMRLQHKTLLVLGGGGIGAGLARRFAQEGANVVLGDIAAEPAKAVTDEITAAGGQAMALSLDGSDEQSVAAAIEASCNRFGGIDGMHVNFATFVDNGFDTGVLDLPLDLFDETMRVNLRGYYLCTRVALPKILERGGGSIVYTSSPASVKGEPTRVAYAVAKAGVEALMRHVAARYGARGVRANCIAPGSTLHARLEQELDDATKQWCLNMAAIKSRLGRPEDIAAMSALLMADEGAYITGQVIGVDGGVIMRR